MYGEGSEPAAGAAGARCRQAPKKAATKRQQAGRDYQHELVCMQCGDGGLLVQCDLCPVSCHAECVGFDHAEVAAVRTWYCPHHACLECGRKAAAVGGLLFRCEWCTNAFCEDHLPIDAELVGRCERYERLGMRHPDQACYIHCQEQCKEIAKEKKLEAAQAAAGGGEGRGRKKKKSPPGSAKQRGGGAKRAKHARSEEV